jgi:sugar phosphate permease
MHRRVAVAVVVGVLTIMAVVMAVARAIGMDVFMPVLVMGIIAIDPDFAGAATACGAHGLSPLV